VGFFVCFFLSICYTLNMTVQELTDKYIKEGKDSTSAWWWAHNPMNPESPRYNKDDVENVERIKEELGLSW